LCVRKYWSRRDQTLVEHGDSPHLSAVGTAQKGELHPTSKMHNGQKEPRWGQYFWLSGLERPNISPNALATCHGRLPS
jgi:hypothetical protein